MEESVIHVRRLLTLVVIVSTGALIGCAPEDSEGRAADTREFNCPAPAKSESELQKLDLLSHHGPIVPTDAQLDGLQAFVKDRRYQDWCQDRFRDAGIRVTGPILPARSRVSEEVKNRAFSTHARVKVYYSEAVVEWLKNGRIGKIADGAMIVKAMWPGLGVATDDKEIDGWAVMVRDSKASYDGWLWYLYYRQLNVPYKLEFESGQYGLSFCLACHASATNQSTFAALDNLTNTNPVSFVRVIDPRLAQSDRDSAHDLLAEFEAERLGSTEEKQLRKFSYQPLQFPESRPKKSLIGLLVEHGQLPNAAEIAAMHPRELPLDVMYDHLPPTPGEQRSHFATSSVCNGCHDATDLLNGTNPEMSVPLHGQKFDKIVVAKDPVLANLSAYGEWSGSLMAVAVRDPVFRAQLESETTKYPDTVEYKAASEITQRCLSCHAAMGYRTNADLARNLRNTYAIPDAGQSNPDAAAFGALARDGVSCAVCHHISDENLGEPSTFNANFELGPADELYGPFEEVQTSPMVTALGVTPVHGAQVSDSGMCGSCHMVDVPVMDDPGKKTAHEQTTYYEWRNSAFARDGEGFRSCQNCHMPNIDPLAPGRPLVDSKIANIEDTSFPHTTHRASSDEIDTVKRPGYRRHTLTGINLFTMAMFEQFPLVLGSNTWYPSRPVGSLVPPKGFAIAQAAQLAREATAKIGIAEVTRDGSLRFTVTVENLAGHKFPSGVGFRRAYLEIALLNSGGDPVWCSGCSDENGVLLDGVDGSPLATEFPQESDEVEPYRARITAQNQVQIYENRHRNYARQLTTSFVELDKEVKDTRILPRGWDPDGFPDYRMNPVGRDIPEPAHIDVVEVEPLDAKITAEHTIRVRIYYQALPPYYLLDRFALLRGVDPSDYPETQRLLHIVSRLNLGKTSSAGLIDGWRLLIDEALYPERIAGAVVAGTGMD